MRCTGRFPRRCPDRHLARASGARRPGSLVSTAPGASACGAGGLYILDAKGKKLGRIVHGEAATTNMAFGGDDGKTLYFTTRSTLYTVTLKVAGVPVPVDRKSA